jgi:hypothetical protein
MPKQANDPLRIRLVYDGVGPVFWNGGPDAFGLQDKAAVLHPGTPGAGGAIVFDFTLQAKPAESGAVVLSGDFAHGPPSARFLYLGWRNVEGHFAQRLKLSLATIGWEDVQQAFARQVPLAGTLVDHHPRATSTGANIGGSRPIAWALAD